MYAVAFVSSSSTPPVAKPPASDNGAASAGISIGIVLVLVVLAMCASAACLVLGWFYRHGHRKAKRLEEDEAAQDVNEIEHEGVGEVPAVSTVTVKQPAIDEMDIAEDGVVEVLRSSGPAEFFAGDEEDNEGGGSFMDVGRDANARRRFAV
mmetsp:Transcript_66517/g.208243  ORF Transcript_66517/g.208243 Transcript_66517/m.208243 type:complete len:151 (+) Transcript_66517:2-454(+)